MTEQDIEKIVREYITKTYHLSLATVKDNKPWVCEVHFAADDNLNLYFISMQSTRHCKEIAENPNVAGDIIKQHPLNEAPRGIYFEGIAEQIDASDDDVAYYCSAMDREFAKVRDMLKEPNGRRMYRITPSKWATFGNFDGKGMVKHELEWGK